MIKMGRYNYAFQNFDATRHVRASIREKKISHKHARETATAIKGLSDVSFLELKLEHVLLQKKEQYHLEDSKIK